MNVNKEKFLFEKGITYLNHGSFGACPKTIFEDYQNWQLKLEKQPVQFFTEEVYTALKNSRVSLGKFLGCEQDELLLTAEKIASKIMRNSPMAITRAIIGVRPMNKVVGQLIVPSLR